MIKRPLNPKFSAAVREGRKFTTIREKPWPVGKPIMLYNWSGAPYRSPQVDVGAVEVTRTYEIRIQRTDREVLFYLAAPEIPGELWQCEGFESRAEMESWFAATMKPGQSVTKHLMRFRLLNAGHLAAAEGGPNPT